MSAFFETGHADFHRLGAGFWNQEQCDSAWLAAHEQEHAVVAQGPDGNGPGSLPTTSGAPSGTRIRLSVWPSGKTRYFESEDQSIVLKVSVPVADRRVSDCAFSLRN